MARRSTLLKRVDDHGSRQWKERKRQALCVAIAGFSGEPWETRTIHLRNEAITKEEGRPSGWKDGLSRSFVHCSTHRLSRKEGVEASG